MLGWLLVVALGIIWATFLFPFLRRRRSPVTTVEEFEQKMDFLAETNVSPRGRWVITPRTGEPFLGERGRSRNRVRERRRQVFTLLIEATGLALLIGLFPPFHRILLGAAALGGLLFIYTLLLIRIRSIEGHRARLRRARRAGVRTALYPATAYGYAPAPVWGAGTDRHSDQGGGRLSRPNTNGRAAYRSNGSVRSDPYGDGWGAPGTTQVLERDDEPVIHVDEDVHIIVHRSDELYVRGLRAALAQ